MCCPLWRRPFLDEWDRGFAEAQEEPEGYWLEAVYGSVPRELHGTLFRWGWQLGRVGGASGPSRGATGGNRVASQPACLPSAPTSAPTHLPAWPLAAMTCRNGAGKATIGGGKAAHPLDGDGLMMASISFRDGAAFFRSR